MRKKKVHGSLVCYYSYRITAHHPCLHCVYALYIIITRVLPKVTSTQRRPANNTRRHLPAETLAEWTALKGFSKKMGEGWEWRGASICQRVTASSCVYQAHGTHHKEVRLTSVCVCVCGESAALGSQPSTTFACCRCERNDPAVLIKTNGSDRSPLIVFHWQMAPLTPEDRCRGPARLQHNDSTNESRRSPSACARVCVLGSACAAFVPCAGSCKVGYTATLGPTLAMKLFFSRQSSRRWDIVNARGVTQDSFGSRHLQINQTLRPRLRSASFHMRRNAIVVLRHFFNMKTAWWRPWIRKCTGNFTPCEMSTSL